MFLHKDHPFGSNFKASSKITETKEVLFPITESQDVDAGTTIDLEVNEMTTIATIGELSGNATINVAVDEQVSEGAELILVIPTAGTQTVTWGTGFKTDSTITGASGGSVFHVTFRYFGGEFMRVSTHEVS